MDEQIKILISQYVDGQTNSEESQLVRQYIEKDQECANYYKELQRLSTQLKSWDDEELSHDFDSEMSKILPVSRPGKRLKMKGRKDHYMAMRIATVLIVATAGIIGMQTYSHRALQARVRDAAKYMAQNTPNAYIKRGVQGRLKQAADDIGSQYKVANGATIQYQPYYLGTDYNVKREERVANAPAMAAVMPTRTISKTYDKFKDGVSATDLKHRVRKGAGTQASTYSYELAEMSSWGGVMPMGRLPQEQDLDGRYNKNFNTEQYDHIVENEFLAVDENPLSTFSIDVDTGSYTNIRRMLTNNQFPSPDAVRIEEMINYFSYDYPQPESGDPFSINIDAAKAPWNTDHHLVRIGLKGMSLEAEELPPSNLVFLIDVSGSMSSPDKLPLLKQAFKMMVDQLSEKEKVGIVVYAGAAGVVLEPTSGDNKQAIKDAIDRLHSGGSTAGGAGILRAYELAKKHFIKDGNNRVILASDGDFNVGVSSRGDLIRLIEEKRNDGIFLTVLGFGTGNLKDSQMEQIANKGNGSYYYIDTDREAKKVLISELGSTLFTIAKDVKIQIEFNPAQVKAYRLIGYENRLLAKEDFNDDTKDAGELGAGHTVTALYEIVPANSDETFGSVDDLKYQKKKVVSSNEMMTVKLRYKKPNEDKSKLLSQTINTTEVEQKPKGDFEFVSAVAEFGMVLRNSKHKGSANYQSILTQAQSGKGADKFGYRDEFISLVEKAKANDTRGPGVIQFK